MYVCMKFVSRVVKISVLRNLGKEKHFNQEVLPQDALFLVKFEHFF